MGKPLDADIDFLNLDKPPTGTDDTDIVEMNQEDDPFDKNKTPYRWLIFGLFMMSILISSSTSLVFSAISPMLADTFDVSVIMVNMCANVFNASFIPITFLAMYAYKHYPTSWVLRVASFIFVLGAWIRYLSDDRKTFLPLLLG